MGFLGHFPLGPKGADKKLAKTVRLPVEDSREILCVVDTIEAVAVG